jgi:hypothetical protein
LSTDKKPPEDLDDDLDVVPPNPHHLAVGGKPKNEVLESFAKKGLTPQESLALYRWCLKGKPGLAKSRAEHLGEIFILGYSVQDINKWFPEYTIPTLLYARVQYDWDRLRDEYRRTIYDQTLKTALTTRMESLRFLSDYLTATHKSWSRELMDYLADPDNVPRPAFLPATIYVYSQAIAMFESLLKLDKKIVDGKKASPLDGMPLVAISVNQDSRDTSVRIGTATQDDVKKALLKARSIKPPPPPTPSSDFDFDSGDDGDDSDDDGGFNPVTPDSPEG